MVQIDMFGVEVVCDKSFYDYALAGDRKGALDRLCALSPSSAQIEILSAGFSTIGYKGNTKSEFVSHAVGQIGKREPRRVKIQ